MKEIGLSFSVKISLKRTGVHWVEEELLRLWQEVFLEVFRLVLEEIERGQLERLLSCKQCCWVVVCNGRQARKLKTLVWVMDVKRLRLRCQGCS